MAVTFAGNVITVNTTGGAATMDDFVTAVGGATCTLLIAEARVFQITNHEVQINDNAEFDDSEFTLYHYRASTTDEAWLANGAGSLVTWGEIDDVTSLTPQCTEDCHYMWDYNGGSAMYWSKTGTGIPAFNGDLNIFGGIFENLPRGSTSSGQFIYMWSGDTNVIGVNMTRWGGHRCWGTTYRYREIICSGNNNSAPGASPPSGPYGFSLGGVTVRADGLIDIVMQNNSDGYYFWSANGGDLRDARIRDCARDLVFNSTTAAFLVNITDSTPYANATGSNAGDIFEFTSYNVKCVEEDGVTAIQNVRVRVWRDTPSTVEIINALTDSGGIPAGGEMLLLNTALEGTGTFGSQTQYGPYFTRVRDYGRDYISATRTQRPPTPIVDNLIMVESGLTQDGTTDTTVAAFTGIAQTEGSSTITITEAHTVKEIFSWLQYHNALSTQMDRADNTIPLVTFDGATYTIISGWTMSNISLHIDLEGQVLELANSNRWVPIHLTGLQEFANFRIATDPADATLYSGEINLTLEFLTKREWLSSNINVEIVSRLQGYLADRQTGVIGDRGLVVPINQVVNPNWKFPFGRMRSTHFRWRNDNGTETTATWKANEDTDITGQAKTTNFRLRLQHIEDFDKDAVHSLKYQYRLSTNDFFTDL